MKPYIFLMNKVLLKEEIHPTQVGVAKFDTTREPDTTRHEISRLWVEA